MRFSFAFFLLLISGIIGAFLLQICCVYRIPFITFVTERGAQSTSESI